MLLVVLANVLTSQRHDGAARLLTRRETHGAPFELGGEPGVMVREDLSEHPDLGCRTRLGHGLVVLSGRLLEEGHRGRDGGRVWVVGRSEPSLRSEREDRLRSGERG